MQNDTSPHGRRSRSLATTRDALVLVLAFTSGYVDAVSYLGLGHVFTSNMTGNTVLLGLAIGQVKGLAALRSLAALAGFICGVAAGAVILDRPQGRSLWPAGVTTACAAELGVLVVLSVWGAGIGAASDTSVVYALIALSAIAMGLQSMAVRALGVNGVATTYITGTWTSLVSGITERLLRASGASKPSGSTSGTAQGAGLQAGVVCVYLAAAVAGGVAETKWQLAAAVVPTMAVALVVAIALTRLRGEE